VPDGYQINVVLVDDHQILRDGLRGIIDREPDMHVIGEASDGYAAIQVVRELKPDVVVMDVGMPRLDGIQATKRICAEIPGARVVVLSMHGEGQYVLEMLRAGASGYLLKDCAQDDLTRAIRAVGANLTFFSPGIADTVVESYARNNAQQNKHPLDSLTGREREVLRLLADGKSTKDIAAHFGVCVKTIEAHRRRIKDKLELRSIAELTKYAIREGLTALSA
jgi:two-component system response regulator NreC